MGLWSRNSHGNLHVGMRILECKPGKSFISLILTCYSSDSLSFSVLPLHFDFVSGISIAEAAHFRKANTNII